MEVIADSANISFINGVYEVMSSEINGSPAWQYGQYIIQKTNDSQYWTIDDQTDGDLSGELSADDLVSMDNNYNWRPPEYSYWQFWNTRPNPTHSPTESPSVAPTAQTLPPTVYPSENPTADPTTEPTMEPTTNPTIPSEAPSKDPTTEPTIEPTSNPTEEPTMEPTSDPTHDPSQEPTIFVSDDPTTEPTLEPTRAPVQGIRRRSLLQNDPPQGIV